MIGYCCCRRTPAKAQSGCARAWERTAPSSSPIPAAGLFATGVAGVAVGWAGIAALRDWRGERDMHGKVLEITLEAIVDEIAAAANLLMGEAGDGTPAVVFRGLEVSSLRRDRLHGRKRRMSSGRG